MDWLCRDSEHDITCQSPHKWYWHGFEIIPLQGKMKMHCLNVCNLLDGVKTITPSIWGGQGFVFIKKWAFLHDNHNFGQSFTLNSRPLVLLFTHDILEAHLCSRSRRSKKPFLTWTHFDRSRGPVNMTSMESATNHLSRLVLGPRVYKLIMWLLHLSTLSLFLSSFSSLS